MEGKHHSLIKIKLAWPQLLIANLLHGVVESYLRLVEQGMQGCKARAEENISVLEVLLGGGAPLRQSSGHHLGAGAVVPHLN